MKTLSITSLALLVCAFSAPASADPLPATKASVSGATKVSTSKPKAQAHKAEPGAVDVKKAAAAVDAELKAEAEREKAQSNATLNQLYDDADELVHMLVRVRRNGEAESIQCVSRALSEVHSAERIAGEQRQALLDAWTRGDVASAKFAFELVSRERARGTEKRLVATSCENHKRYVPDTTELRIVVGPDAKATSPAAPAVVATK